MLEMRGLYHDGNSNENVKTNGVLFRNCQTHDIVVSYVFGRHGLWPSLSNPEVTRTQRLDDDATGW